MKSYPKSTEHFVAEGGIATPPKHRERPFRGARRSNGCHRRIVPSLATAENIRKVM